MKKLLALGAVVAAIFFIRAEAQVVPAPPGTAAMVCANNTAVPTPTSGSFFYVQCDSNGKLITTGSGGGGSPGGTNGQIQFNSAGSFGGFTASGDATVNTSTGAVALKNTGPGATGPLGSSTTAPVITIDAQGRVTALTSVTIAGGGGSSGITAGTTTTTGITNGHFVGSNGSVVQDQTAVTSLTAGCGLTASTSPITLTGSFTAGVTARNNTATTDTITGSDCGTVVTESNASPVAVAITTSSFTSTNNQFTGKNLGAGVATYTPSSGTINGAATLTCAQGQSFDAYTDTTNWITLSNTCAASSTIASGATALGTGSISSATCASAVTATALGAATTDAMIASFNADPTASTGYIPATAGMLTIFAWFTSNQANFKVCNNTSGSITPSPVTLNWRDVR